MKIQIVSGTGTGPTQLAAFDAALRSAGIANFNLLTLSSVIPPATELSEVSAEQVVLDGAWGDRLYVVLAESHAIRSGTEAWAGLGWVQDAEQGHGLFVEHHGDSRRVVQQDITASLGSLMEGRGLALEPKQTVTGIACTDQPACAVVAAIYRSASWTA